MAVNTESRQYGKGGGGPCGGPGQPPCPKKSEEEPEEERTASLGPGGGCGGPGQPPCP